MEEKQILELIINSTDDDTIREIESHLSSLEITRSREARVIDPVTALAIAAGTMKLISEVLSLWEKLRKKPDAPRVTVRSINGDTIVLSEVTAEQLRAFLQSVATSQ